MYAHEALVRGPAGEGAPTVLAQVTPDNLYAFDQACRVRALELAAALSPAAALPSISINFFPGAVYRAETCIRKTLETAQRVTSRDHLMSIFREYRKTGLKIAIDDFGAGYAGLDLLAEFQPDILKLDMALVRDIDSRPASRAIVRAVASMCRDLGVELVAEGVERVGELSTLRDLGVELFQGYLLAKPLLEGFASPMLPEQSRRAAPTAPIPAGIAKSAAPPTL